MLTRLLRIAIACVALAAPGASWGQSAVVQGGAQTAGHAPMYFQTGTSQPIVIDSGPAGGNTTGQGLSELNITSRGTGTAPFSGQGTGPNGETFCMQDAVSSNATGYHYLCLSPNATGGSGLLSFGAVGSATPTSLKFKVNGTSYTFPFAGTGTVTGPATSTIGHSACWNDTLGTVLSDCGAAPSVGGTSGQIQYNNAGSFGGFTMAGDCTLSQPNITCTKINGVGVSLAGTLTTAGQFTTSGAFSLTLTTTNATNVTLPTTGTLATLAGTEALTNKTYNGNTWTAGTGTLTIGAGKTLTASSTITFTATDGSTLAIGTGGTLGTAAYTAATAYVPSNTQVTNSIAGDVALNNTANYFDGPSVAQGSSGTWFCSGTVSINDTAGAANIYAKLWDGTTVLDSAVMHVGGANQYRAIALSGYLASPAANIRISVKDVTTTTGVMLFNTTGNSKDSTVSCFRVN